MGLTESKLFTDCLEFVMAAPNPKLVRCLIYYIRLRRTIFMYLLTVLFAIPNWFNLLYGGLLNSND